MSNRIYYVVCQDNCRFESLTKEQIFAAIAEATGNTPTPVNEAFITKIKELNLNANLEFWLGTEAQFNALSPAPQVTEVPLKIGSDGKVYFCSDDTYFADLNNNLISLNNRVEVCEEDVAAGVATIAGKADNPTQFTALPTSGTALTNNAEYRVAEAVGTYEFAWPSVPFECWLKFSTAASFSITFPVGTTYIGGAPEFEASKIYEMSVKDSVVVCKEVKSQ